MSDSPSLESCYTYWPNFLKESEANLYFDQLMNGIQWKEKSIMIFGKKRLQPRLVAYYGDEAADYKYSGVKQIPLPWTQDLLALKNKVEQRSKVEFNSVLLNLYRNGRDSMGSHRDNEPELGEEVYIGSVSLGEPRILRFRSIDDTKQREDLVLEHGSLLLMRPQLQKYFKHEIPK